MKIRLITPTLFLACTLCACEPKENVNNPDDTPLTAPSEVSVTQVSEDTFDVSWKDNSKTEKGFAI